MSKVFMKNVGSAQHILFGDLDQQELTMVDWGIGRDYIYCAHAYNIISCPTVCNPTELIISHFHYDHINGFEKFYGNGNLTYPFRFNHIYYPKMPQMAGTNAVSPILVKLLVRVITLNLQIILSHTMLNLYNFINTMLRQRVGIIFKPINDADTLFIGNKNIDILWPEHNISSIRNTTITNFVNIFNDTMKVDDSLREIYNFVQDHLMQDTNNLQDELILSEELINNWTNNLVNTQVSTHSHNILNLYNTKIKDVLNKYSLAFKVDNEILFLGDLTKKPMNNTVNKLNGQNNYDIVIAAHHGTCCGKKFEEKIKANYCIASIGRGLMGSKAQIDGFASYNRITSNFRTTYKDGDIII